MAAQSGRGKIALGPASGISLRVRVGSLSTDAASFAYGLTPDRMFEPVQVRNIRLQVAPSAGGAVRSGRAWWPPLGQALDGSVSPFACFQSACGFSIWSMI
jgi:hypothetical protein